MDWLVLSRSNWAEQKSQHTEYAGSEVVSGIVLDVLADELT